MGAFRVGDYAEHLWEVRPPSQLAAPFITPVENTYESNTQIHSFDDSDLVTIFHESNKIVWLTIFIEKCNHYCF